MIADAPSLSVRDVACFEWPFVLRLPFRFGAITVTEGRQLVMRVRITLSDGREATGMAAEALGAKWFDKAPSLTDDQNLDQLRRSIELARAAYLAHGLDTAFGHFANTYAALMAAGAAERLPPLVVGYGPALLDRCIADALGRLLNRSFFSLVRGNALGLRPEPLAPDLSGFESTAFLASLEPVRHLHVRHTVGMLDPIVGTDQRERVGDGLPETLEEVAAAYGHRYFKLKLSGMVAADIDRLSRIAAVLDRSETAYWATLDGNEQFADADGVRRLLDAVAAEPLLARLRQSLLFIEQPIRRADALREDVSALTAFAPLLLDESDGAMDIFPKGRRAGYRGISSKACKGFYKSLINRMRCAAWNAETPAAPYFMSGEDLTTLAGVAVQQDLALAAILGLTHVERNGHHFVDGFGNRPEAAAFLAAHPDLYHRVCGHVRLRIASGQVDTGSLGCVGFATAVHPDLSALSGMPRSRWSP